ncbi:MAG: hypothetical protein IPI68_06755 [Chitinophagaceae bacterium]|nr:hypothetical protein [Chitinophagaceae bacterium]
MAIPKNITKEHLLKAISKIDIEGIPKDSDSQFYDVVYDEKKYPPKVIVSYANLFANGEIIDRNSFAGGLNTECFNLLELNGFKIFKKEMGKSKEIILEIVRLCQTIADGRDNGSITQSTYTTIFRPYLDRFEENYSVSPNLFLQKELKKFYTAHLTGISPQIAYKILVIGGDHSTITLDMHFL